MEQKRKDSVLHCLLTGKLRIKLDSHYYLITPPQDIRISAYIYHEKLLESVRFEQWYNSRTIEQVLIGKGILSLDYDKNLLSLNESLENLKVSLYESIYDSIKSEKIRKQIRLVKDKIVDIENKRNMFYHLTLEGYSAKYKLMYLVAGCLYHELTNIKHYNNYDILDYDFLSSIVSEKCNIEPKEEEIREISRTHPWRSIWSLGKPNPLNLNFLDLSEYQQSLYIYSHMYDNIRESMDCPSDAVINDDDCCDGWLIVQSRKNNKDKKERQTEKILNNRSKDAQEIFLPAYTDKDLKEIQSLNDVGTKIKLAQREKQIKEAGQVKDIDLVGKRIEIKERALQKKGP